VASVGEDRLATWGHRLIESHVLTRSGASGLRGPPIQRVRRSPSRWCGASCRRIASCLPAACRAQIDRCHDDQPGESLYDDTDHDSLLLRPSLSNTDYHFPHDFPMASTSPPKHRRGWNSPIGCPNRPHRERASEGLLAECGKSLPGSRRDPG